MADHRAPRHIPNAELAVHALDGSRTAWSAPAVRHLRDCPACRDQLTAYERAAEAGRLTYPGDGLQVPSPRVWAEVRTHMAADRPSTPPATRRPHRHALRRALRRASDHARRRSTAVVRALCHRLARLFPGRSRGPRT